MMDRECMRGVVITAAALVCAQAVSGAAVPLHALEATRATASAPASLPATQLRTPRHDGTTHLLIITGLSGEERFAAAYAEWGSSLVTAAAARFGIAPANAVWLAENEEVHAAVRGRSTRENVEAEIRAIIARAAPADRVIIMLFGHGSADGGETRINLPGPDITGKEFAALLAPLATQRVAVINAASASGGFIQDLAGANRVVITATKSGFERNETVFGQHFVAALTSDDADADRDGRISLLEAFEYTRREVEREYQRGNKLLTEHAMLDAVGDGRGVTTVETGSPHAVLARSFIIGGTAATAGAAASPELRALQAEKDRLDGELDALRARKASMTEAAYEAALEKLMIEVSLNAQAIRRAQGGG